MERLNEKISEILKTHKEGEAFFNALDYIIRGDRNILGEFMKFVYASNMDFKKYNLVLSGNFGMALIQNYGKELYNTFNNVFIVTGGVRKGNIPEFYNTDFGNKDFIFLDDSFYSGNTRNTIDNEIDRIDSFSQIVLTFVIYDGSQEKEHNVHSLYRYYE